MLIGARTDSQKPQVPAELGFLLQDPQHVGGLHALQLHLPVDVDFVIEADVDQTGAVLTLLTRVLTCTHTGTWRIDQSRLSSLLIQMSY